MKFSDSWQKNVRVGQYASLLNGFAFSSEGFTDDDGMPLIRIRDLRSQTTEVNFRGSFNAKYVVRYGDLLIGMDGDFDTVKWQGNDALLNQRVCKLESKDQDVLVQDFLFYRIINEVLRINRITAATTVKHLSSEDVLGITIDLPPKLEQSKIAEILSTIDSAIEQTEALIAKQQRIKIGLMQDLLTKGIDEHGNIRSEATHAFKDSPLGRIPVEWEVRCLDEISSDISDCPHTTPSFSPEGVLVIRTFNIKDGRFCGDHYFVTESEYLARVSRLTPQERDIVFTREAPVGEAFIIPPGMRLCLGQRTMLIRLVEKKLEPEYFVGLIYSEEMRFRFTQIVGGTTNPHLNVADVRRLRIKVPPYCEQTEISQKISSIRAVITTTSESKEKLYLLKQGLMHDLLTGERRVTPLLAQPAS